MNRRPIVHITYLVNQYPAPSHSFIRREIAALRELGRNVTAVSVRRSAGPLVAEADRRQAATTQVILDAGVMRILGVMMLTLLRHPRATAAALRVTFALRRGADRGTFHHLAYFAEACVFRHWLRERGTTHLHVHMGTNAAAVGMICHALGGPPWSFTAHGPEEFERGDAIALRQKIADAAFVVGVSEFATRQLRRWCDAKHWDKLKVVRCGVDQAFFAAPITPVPDVNRIVCVGRLCAAKMQHVLIEAIAKLAARGVDVDVTLVGDGETRGELEHQVDALDVRPRVRFTGWADERAVREELIASRAMVLPSRAEGLPVVIMEAFALGRPAISTTIAAIPELIEPGRSGWLVPPGDAEQLAAAIEACLNTPASELSEMAMVGRERVAELHDASKNTAVLAALLEP
jgi:glycosyltransferase involved in cell wall biosynthesis